MGSFVLKVEEFGMCPEGRGTWNGFHAQRSWRWSGGDENGRGGKKSWRGVAGKNQMEDAELRLALTGREVRGER